MSNSLITMNGNSTRTGSPGGLERRSRTLQTRTLALRLSQRSQPSNRRKRFTPDIRGFLRCFFTFMFSQKFSTEQRRNWIEHNCLNEFQNVSRTTVVDLQNVNLLTPPRSTDTGGVLEYGAHRPFPFNSSDPLLISLYRSLYWLQCHFHWTRCLSVQRQKLSEHWSLGRGCFASFSSRLIKALLTSWINVQSICFSSRSKSVKLIDWLKNSDHLVRPSVNDHLLSSCLYVNSTAIWSQITLFQYFVTWILIRLIE